MTTLLLTTRHSGDDQRLWRAAIARGWQVERIAGVRVPADLDGPIAIYVEPLYGPFIASKLRRVLLEPALDLLATIPIEYVHRTIRACTLANAREHRTPAFIKPPNDKSFVARVYRTGDELPPDLANHMPVLVADPVTFLVEHRCFVLNRKVVASSPYRRHGVLSETQSYDAPDQECSDAVAFASGVINDRRVVFPTAVVLDVGQLADGRWAVVEANGAWGSGLYGCDAAVVLDVIAAATSNMTT